MRAGAREIARTARTGAAGGLAGDPRSPAASRWARWLDELVAFSGGASPAGNDDRAHAAGSRTPRDPEAHSGAIDGGHGARRSRGWSSTWARLTPNERKALGAVAAGQRQISSKAALQLSGVAKSSQLYAADRLVDHCVLRVSSDGLLSIVDPLLAHWLRAG